MHGDDDGVPVLDESTSMASPFRDPIRVLVTEGRDELES